MLRKFTNAEGPAEAVSPEGHQALQGELNRLSKTSAQDLSEEERERIRLALDQSS